MQDDDRAVVRAQLLEGPLELVAHRHVRDGVAVRGRMLIAEWRDGDPEPAGAPRLGQAGADDDPVRPGLEAIGVAQVGSSRQMATSACCTASSARSVSRTIRWATR